ncbi:hypothetical protein, partial [Lutibacter sp.]
MKNILAFLLILSSTIALSQNDCADVLVVCGNSGYQDLSVTGFGVQELNNSNSCASQENNSIWFKLTISTGGTLGFTLTPSTSDIQEDFDFFIFGPNASCGNLGQAIRCSTTNPFAANQGNNLTGMNGTEIDTSEGPGSDGNSFVKWLTVADGDTYFLVIDRPIGTSNFSLEWTGSATFSEQPTFENPTVAALNLQQCDTDTILDEKTIFDLSQNTSIAIGSQTGVAATYHTSNNDALTGVNQILNPTTFENTTNPQTIYLRLTNSATQCFDVAAFTLTVNPTIALGTPENLSDCDSNGNGFFTFNLSQNNTKINPDLSTNIVSYFDNENDAITNNTATILPINYSNKIAYTSEIIWARVESLATGCFSITNFTIEVFALPTITNSVELKQCDNDTDGFSAFNLTEANNKISSNAANETFTYFETLLGADTNKINQQITTPTAYVNQNVTTDTVWARVENSNGCHRVSELNLVVSTTGIPASFQKVYYQCDDFVDAANNDRDGIASFDFSEVTAEIKNILSASGQQLVIQYYRNEADALAEINPILDPSNYRNIGYPNYQQIYIRVDSKLDNDCLGFGVHITLNVEKIPFANTVTINRQCDDDFDGFFSFDTASVEATVLNNQTNVTVSYFDENNAALPSPLPNPFFTKSQIITIRVTNNTTNVTTGACFDETTLEFIVDKKPVANAIPNLIACDDDFDGMFNFDTSTIESSILNGQTGMLVSYFDQNGNPLPSPLPNPFFTNTSTITVKVENEVNTTCIAQTTVEFIVKSKPQFELDKTAIYCLNLPPITVETYNALDTYTYEWKNENGTIISTSFNAVISAAEVYTVIATSTEGCESFPQTITIEPSIIASISDNDITVVDDSDNNSISIATENLGIGDYE